MQKDKDSRAPRSGAVGAGSPAFAPNTQLFSKGKEGSHRPCPLREGAEQFAETLPSSKEGRITRGGGPDRTEDSPWQGSRCLPQWDSGREKGSEGEAGTQGDGGLHGIWVFLDAA